ncbi:MAG: tetratricopeptide repeat protein [Rhodanobacter sp.]
MGVPFMEFPDELALDLSARVVLCYRYNHAAIITPFGMAAATDRSGQMRANAGKQGQRGMETGRDSPTLGKRLDTWKAISAFFVRDERTVRRWEATRGMPIHRLPGQGRANVYAYTIELAAWLDSAGHELDEAALGKVGNGDGASWPRATDPGHTPALPQESDVLMAEPAVATNSLPAAGPAPVAGYAGVDRRRASRRKQAAHRKLPIFPGVAALLIGAAVVFFWFNLRHVPATPATPAMAARSAHVATAQVEELYLRGSYAWNKRTRESLNEAVVDYSQAIALDPDFAEAYVGLANCYLLLREYSLMPAAAAYANAEQAAQHAVALDESLSGAHSALGFVDFFWHWDAARAQKEFQRAIALDPKSILAHHWYATSLMSMGRFPESLAQIEQARELDPGSTTIFADRGLILYGAGQWRAAFQSLKELETSDPTFLSPHLYLANMYLASGDNQKYLTESRAVASLLHDDKRMILVDAAQDGFTAGGRRGMLRRMLDVEQRQYLAGDASAYELATICSWLGDKPGALKYLQIALAEHDPGLIGVRDQPAFAVLHPDPSFQRILARVGLPALPVKP